MLTEGTMITAQDTAALARKQYDFYNARTFDKNIECASPNIQLINVATGQTYKGHAALREYLQNWATAMPDSKVEVLNVVATDTYTVAECVGRGTHKGPLTGPTGTIQPTGKKIELHFCEVYKFENGKITEDRVYFDAATMLRQMGVIS